MRRVVITGAGVRTAFGADREALIDGLLAGRSAVRHMEQWAATPELASHVAAPVEGFDEREIPRKLRRTMGRVAMLGVAAARDAVRESGLSEAVLTSTRAGVAAGSTLGSAGSDEELWSAFLGLRPSRRLRSGVFFQTMSHTLAANVAMVLGTRGETHSVNAACASGTQAMGLGFARVRSGQSDVVVCGGADELHIAATATFDGLAGASRGFNDAPNQTPRPFDAGRDGIVVGEGGGFAVLEAAEHAARRGARPLAEVIGYGSTTDGQNMASPGVDGMEAAIRAALDDAGIPPDEVDYVNAHATGTPIGDAAEAEAILRVFGTTVPVSSFKGHLGHTLGACGAIELAAILAIFDRGLIPGTRNLEDPDVAPIWLVREPVERPVHVAVSVNFAFGGINTALVVRKLPAGRTLAADTPSE